MFEGGGLVDDEEECMIDEGKQIVCASSMEVGRDERDWEAKRSIPSVYSSSSVNSLIR